MSSKTCQECARPLRAYDLEDDSNNRDFYDDDMSGWKQPAKSNPDICSACERVECNKAFYIYCHYHDNYCVLPEHYVNSVYLTRRDECIEAQDITTLMINASYQRWKDGEENEFFERITTAAAEIEKNMKDMD